MANSETQTGKLKALGKKGKEAETRKLPYVAPKVLSADSSFEALAR